MDDPQPRCRILRKAKVSVRINCLAKILHRNLIELACGGPRGKPLAADGLLVVDDALRDLLQLIGTFGILGLESLNCCCLLIFRQPQELGEALHVLHAGNPGPNVLNNHPVIPKLDAKRLKETCVPVKHNRNEKNSD